MLELPVSGRCAGCLPCISVPSLALQIHNVSFCCFAAALLQVVRDASVFQVFLAWVVFPMSVFTTRMGLFLVETESLHGERFV